MHLWRKKAPDPAEEIGQSNRENDREFAYQRLRSRAITLRVDRMLAEVHHVEKLAAESATPERRDE